MNNITQADGGWGFPMPDIYPYQIQHPRLAYKQGDLDGLCGIYSIINAIRLLRGPLPQRVSETLFKALVTVFDQRWGLKMAALEGINSHQLSYLIKTVAVPVFELHYRKPFHNRPTTPQMAQWDQLSTWINAGGCAIIGTEEHWTVINKVTQNTLYLTDSCDMQQLRKRYVTHHPEYIHRPWPTYTYLFKRQEDV